jgi:transcriptional regulator with XRE-family HTH domain
MKSSPRPCLSDLASARVVRDARKKAKLSQEGLAELAGLHRTYVSLLERSRRSPTLATLEAIARALGMTPATLIGLIAEAAGETTEPSPSPRNEEAPSTEPRHAPSTDADR